jgi:hypothetical protein
LQCPIEGSFQGNTVTGFVMGAIYVDVGINFALNITKTLPEKEFNVSHILYLIGIT